MIKFLSYIYLRLFSIRKPWGGYLTIRAEPGFQVKRIWVNKGQSLSLQSHKHRSEHWIIVAGTAEIILGSKQLKLKAGENIFIKQGVKHRLANRGANLLVVIEVQLGDYLGEDDIIRYKDIYGRAD